MTVRERKVLAYVNRLRARLDLGPLDELPKGEPCVPSSCPIARAIDPGDEGWAEVRRDVIAVHLIGQRDIRLNVKPPKYVAAFIEAFDCRKYPHLLARGER